MGISSQNSQDLEMESEMIAQLIIIQDEIEDERARGILRQIIGTNSFKLSENQQHIFNTIIEPYRASRFVVCQRCSQTVDTNFASDISGKKDYICENCSGSYMAK